MAELNELLEVRVALVKCILQPEHLLHDFTILMLHLETLVRYHDREVIVLFGAALAVEGLAPIALGLHMAVVDGILVCFADAFFYSWKIHY